MQEEVDTSKSHPATGFIMGMMWNQSSPSNGLDPKSQCKRTLTTTDVEHTRGMLLYYQ